MRQLLARMEKGDHDAALAVEIFASAVRKFIGAYAAELGGLDLLVFTGGIGEHSDVVRGRICQGLEFLGIRPGASGQFSNVMVMTSEEEVQIARHCRRLLRSLDQFLTVIASESTAFLPVTPSRPSNMPTIVILVALHDKATLFVAVRPRCSADEMLLLSLLFLSSFRHQCADAE